MDASVRFYRLEYTRSFLQNFPYTISGSHALAAPMYRARRTGFHRYRQFEDASNKIFFTIDRSTIRSIGDNRILATITPDGTMISTYIGNFTLTGLSLLRRSYVLARSNGDVLMRVQRQWNAQRDRHMIEINAAAMEEHEPFLFALTVLIDSILRRTTNRRQHR